MAQYSNEHLTIAELSAYIDKELTPEELAHYDAHIQTCQPCQAALADLQLTSALLSSMPQVAVPRSFTLPTNLSALPETPAITDVKGSTRPSVMTPTRWRRSLRVVSTLVAVLGLLFFLAGAFSALPHGGASSATSSSSNSVGRVPSSSSSSQAASNSPEPQPSPAARATATHRAAEAMTTPTPFNTQPPYFGPHQSQDQPPTQQPALPAALDPNLPGGRLIIGAALLLLGILGVIATRLFDRASHR